MSTGSSIRQRPRHGPASSQQSVSSPSESGNGHDYQEDDHVGEIYGPVGPTHEFERLLETQKGSAAVVAVLTALAFAVRFYKINHPDQVVFDEVHFGKFAAYYINREYYFDVHPPFAKMLFGLAGWFVGFDGQFKFDNIGDSYSLQHVPYVGMRALPAIMGSLTVPVVYAIMKESGWPTVVAAFSATLILFDNGHIAQSRLILLDAALIFFMSLTVYCYVRFKKLRYCEFTPEWWTWLIATGVTMACTWASKVNGILTVATIGVAVLIDLWDLLDIRKNREMEIFWKHFMARAIGLIAVPFVIYLSFFYIHFSILTYSGPGDSFMSPAFQETLLGNDMLMNSHEIRYYDTINLRHKDTRVFLHSHVERYPLRYDDGRVSSQGQQVTGYGHNDTNNFWQVIPTKALPETGRARIVRHGDIIQLLHVNTDTLLLTHDVASPLMPTNQEFTTWARDDKSRFNDTLFHLYMRDGNDGDTWKTKSGYFRLVHGTTKVSLWTHPGALPEWAFKQQEVNGNKNPVEKTAIWYIDEIIARQGGEPFEAVQKPKAPRGMNFFKKFAELQLLMLQHNAGLTASHPYASGPINWPFLFSGISAWTENDNQKQIYLIGNPVGWWTCLLGLAVFTGVLGADLLARRRAIYALSDPIRNRLWNNTGFFMLVWGVHYLPFFLFSRQLFIHHYLPSHLASSLIAGSILGFVLSETINYPVSVRGPATQVRRAESSDTGLRGPITVVVFGLVLFLMFTFLAPLTYGTPGLTGEEVNSKRLLSSWTLHFAAKKTAEVVL
ncbi:glycosyltransferase family 39 protein [Pluteus cervinus]|uniref:Glycosyltransferase family 39 protein n=1 Tax=Pluteus cervinus TaxID=181527 RepID=A0ACD3B851_9AGAR|nr:glycosyltransferase family 39 protein [Pluteus cervinus]